MSKPNSFGSLGSILSPQTRTACHVAVNRADAARHRSALEAQARKSRRNLANPASFALIEERVRRSA